MHCTILLFLSLSLPFFDARYTNSLTQKEDSCLVVFFFLPRLEFEFKTRQRNESAKGNKKKSQKETEIDKKEVFIPILLLPLIVFSARFRDDVLALEVGNEIFSLSYTSLSPRIFSLILPQFPGSNVDNDNDSQVERRFRINKRDSSRIRDGVAG